MTMLSEFARLMLTVAAGMVLAAVWLLLAWAVAGLAKSVLAYLRNVISSWDPRRGFYRGRQSPRATISVDADIPTQRIFWDPARMRELAALPEDDEPTRPEILPWGASIN